MSVNTVLSKVDDFATFKKVEVHAKNSTFYKVEKREKCEVV